MYESVSPHPERRGDDGNAETHACNKHVTRECGCADGGLHRRVLEGMSVLQQLSQLPTAKANTDSPFFKTAKTIGDSRATVAEKGFGRPLGIKVVVKASNLLSADN